MEKRAALQNLQKVVVRTILGEAASNQLDLGEISHSPLRPYADLIKQISARYVNSETERKICDQKSAEAYALYFMLINYPKLQFLLGFIDNSFFERSLTVLDYGCGTGTATFAVIPKLLAGSRVTGVDYSQPMNDVFSRCVKNFRAVSDVHVNQLLSVPDKGSYDLILASNVFNELSVDAAQEVAGSFIKSLNPGGVLLILEPALLEATRNGMQLRDLILSTSALTPLFPCTRRDGCPMIADTDQWCHGEMDWERPTVVRQLDFLTGFNKHKTKFSGFVFQDSAKLNDGFRVVAPPEHDRRGHAVQLCGKDFYYSVTLPPKKRAESVRPFTKLKLYDRVLISPLPSESKVAKDAKVEIRDRALLP